MAEVSGQDVRPISAVLRGYRRLCVSGEHYPALIPKAGCEVDGVIYRDIQQPAWERLDRFEGRMYKRKVEPVEISAGNIIHVSVYVLRTDYADRVQYVDWDFDAFLRHGKQRFRRSYAGYDEM